VQREGRSYPHSLQVTVCGLFFYKEGGMGDFYYFMKFSESLKSNRDFKNVYSNGKSYANKYLVMYVLENKSKQNRLGISVSKKVGNSVVRHRVTRLVRESYRLHENMFNSGLDMVVVARASTAGASYADIEGALLHVARLHKITAAGQ